MVWNKLQMKFFGTLCVVVVLMTACSVSYKFNGSSIDYTKVKTIAFETFPNRSAGFVWGPMESMFNTALHQGQMICPLKPWEDPVLILPLFPSRELLKL